MAGMANRITFKSLVAVCIFIQMLAVMPHHHHGENHLPCVNLFHCIGESAGCGHNYGSCRVHEAEPQGNAGDLHFGLAVESHSHETCNGDCSFEYKYVICPAREDSRTAVALIADLPVFGILSADGSCDSDRSRHQSQISLLDAKRYIGVPSMHADYITQAIPPRAPSFTA